MMTRTRPAPAPHERVADCNHAYQALLPPGHALILANHEPIAAMISLNVPLSNSDKTSMPS